MAEKPLPQTANVVSDRTAIAMPIKNLIGIIGSVAVGVWAYFGAVERLNNLETNYKLIATDIEKNIEFRIKWPRGELGSLPADAEQYLLLEYLDSQLIKLQVQVEAMMHNKVNIIRLQEDMKEARENIEKLKDKVRENKNGNN
jgi:succinate dehydrogenase/fumarate reductase flavoprotein subunit